MMKLHGGSAEVLVATSDLLSQRGEELGLFESCGEGFLLGQGVCWVSNLLGPLC